MSLTRHPKLDKVWIARIYPNGRRKDPKTGKPSNKRDTYYFEGDEAKARDWYAALVRGPRKSGSVIPLAPTFQQAWADFCLYYKNSTSESTYYDFLKTWERHLRPFFGNLRPGQLNPALFESYKQKCLAEKYLPGRLGQRPEDDTPEQAAKRRPTGKRVVQKRINYLKAMIRWMTDPELGNCATPLTFRVRNFTAAQVEAAPKVIPDRRSVLRFLRALNGTDRIYRSILAIIYYGGFRKNEVFKLKGEQVDLPHDWIYIKGKGNKIRTVPIHGKMRVWVRNNWRKGFLFINPSTITKECSGLPFKDVKKPVKRGARKSGYPPDRLHPHVLRDAFGVHSLQSGISLRALQLAYGHASIKTTERYLTLTPEHLEDEFANFGRKKHRRTAPPRKQGK